MPRDQIRRHAIGQEIFRVSRHRIAQIHSGCANSCYPEHRTYVRSANAVRMLHGGPLCDDTGNRSAPVSFSRQISAKVRTWGSAPTIFKSGLFANSSVEQWDGHMAITAKSNRHFSARTAGSRIVSGSPIAEVLVRELQAGENGRFCL